MKGATTQSETPTRRRRWGRALGIWLTFLLLPVSAAVTYNIIAGPMLLRRVLAEMEARGEPTSYRELIPEPLEEGMDYFCHNAIIQGYALERLEGDSAAELDYYKRIEKFHVLELGTRINESSLPRAQLSGDYIDAMPKPALAQPADLMKMAQYLELEADSPAAAARGILEALAHLEPDLRIMREAAHLPAGHRWEYYRYPAADPVFHASYDYEGVWTTSSWRAHSLLVLGRTKEAFAEVRLMMRLTEMMAAEPALGTATRAGDIAISLGPVVWEGLRTRQWTAEQLAEMAEALSHWKLREARQKSLRYYLLSTVEAEADQLEDSSWRWLDWTGALDFSRAHLLQMATDEVFQPWEAKDWQTLQTKSEELEGLYWGWGRHLNWQLQESWHYQLPLLGARSALVELDVVLLRCALALELYYLAHGHYPDGMEALVPEFLEEVPADPLSHEPLRYSLSADGRFQIYSVGIDQVDDGGKTVLTKLGMPDRTKADWIWRYH